VTRSVDGNFSLVSTTPSYAGGLRIQQIKSSPGVGQPDIIKTYQYSGGILSGEAQYFWKNYVGKLLNGATYTCDRFVTQTLLPVSTNSAGSHIGYSKVRETISGNGYTEYTYSNYDILDVNFEATIDPQKSRYSPFSSRSVDRGLLLKKEIFNQANQPLSKTEYDYQPANLSDFEKATATKRTSVLGGIAIEGSSYKLFDYPKALIKETTTVFDPSTNSTAITNRDFTYESSFNLLSEKTTTDSKGVSIKEEYTYPLYLVQNNQDPASTYAEMLFYNMLSPVVQKKVTKNGTQISLTKTNYSRPFTGIYLPESIQTQSSSASALETRAQYQYDAKGNITSVLRDGHSRISYLWGYNGDYPIAEVKNARPDQIAFANFENQHDYLAGSPSNPGWTIPPFPNNQTSYPWWFPKNSYSGRYSCLAPSFTSKTLSQGTYKVSFYAYGNGSVNVNGIVQQVTNNWRYYSFILNNVTSVVINNSAQMMIDDLRLHPLDAEMTTYTYKPGAGISSVTDAKHQVTHYYYDTFQRLSTIQDEDGNIINQYCYNYAGQASNCTSSAPKWEDVNYKECVIVNGAFTGEQLQMQVDVNPQSASYNQARMRSLGNTGECTTLIIYARLEPDAEQYYPYGYGWDDYGEYAYAEQRIRFYSDSDCNVPLNLPHNITLNGLRTYTGINGAQQTYSLSATGAANWNQTSFGNFMTYHYHTYVYDYDYEYFTTDYESNTFELLPGTNYTVR
jgi:YD repeat-containing protein